MPMNPYQQNYQPQASPVRVITRYLTDIERQAGANAYKKFQSSLRGISFVCLVFLIFNLFILPAMEAPEEVSMIFTIFMIVLGLAAIGMSIGSISLRKKIGDAMRKGTAVEVRGPAYRTSSNRNIPTFTIGPISIITTPEVRALLAEGMQTSIVLVPRLKAAISVNNVPLKNGARVNCPANLEAMAAPVDSMGMPMMQQQAPAYQQYPQQMPPQYPQGGYPPYK